VGDVLLGGCYRYTHIVPKLSAVRGVALGAFNAPKSGQITLNYYRRS
jgi:hypothetical protein